MEEKSSIVEITPCEQKNSDNRSVLNIERLIAAIAYEIPEIEQYVSIQKN